MTRPRPRLTTATLVDRALCQSARDSGCAIAIVDHAERPWSSATFTGSTHLIRLEAVAGPALDAWLAHLPERDWSIRGQLVADCSAQRDATAITVTLLLIADTDHPAPANAL